MDNKNSNKVQKNEQESNGLADFKNENEKVIYITYYLCINNKYNL